MGARVALRTGTPVSRNALAAFLDVSRNALTAFLELSECLGNGSPDTPGGVPCV